MHKCTHLDIYATANTMPSETGTLLVQPDPQLTFSLVCWKKGDEPGADGPERLRASGAAGQRDLPAHPLQPAEPGEI